MAIRIPSWAPPLFALVAGSCLNFGEPKQECSRGDGYCRNGVAYRCRGFQSHWGGGGTEWEGTRCRDQSFCKVDDEGAYCTLTQAADERCEGGGYCDDKMKVSCRSGFPVERKICATCSEEDGCQGNWEDGCNSQRPCGEGLVCKTSGHFSACAPSCDCPDGARCPACDVIGANASGEWICVSKVCKIREY